MWDDADAINIRGKPGVWNAAPLQQQGSASMGAASHTESPLSKEAIAGITN